MNIVFAGGGTGGHVYPAVAIADAMRDRAQVLFIGSADRLESEIVPAAGYPLATISSRPLQRKASVETLLTISSNLAGVTQALKLLTQARPDFVIATGGYVCFPVVVAARLLRTVGQIHAPLALFEPNARAGLTNRILAPLVDEVWGAYADPDPVFARKYVQTGIPVRRSILQRTNRIEAARRLGLDPQRRTILAMGGSQGARSINEAVAGLITRRALPAQWQLLHVSGKRDFEYMQAEEQKPFGENRVTLLPYLADLADAYSVSDLVICRSGASTLGEIAAIGLPSILVPYPFASEDHQKQNALAFAKHGAAVLVEDRELNADTLWWTLSKAMETQRLSAMSGAARSLAPGDPIGTILARIDALQSRSRA
ncbi:MAG: undecaprenyldiphospho-muramoylpentapeptide beta-N-acetylglucosaminyltransferase [Candidatus Eremiobacteraeota bacterium]|nr:undecaprenyldiphospho-muramoylpentapeptide beta-N-acetylglucosaminyltransferase [Candidatus Eremiobacteraeota bacterium]